MSTCYSNKNRQLQQNTLNLMEFNEIKKKALKFGLYTMYLEKA